MSKARDLANAGTALGAVTATELAFVDGVTSAIQTQIDSKIGSASAINPTIVDAKGDIIAATAADTVARLAVGANGTVLTAASGQATGLEWATVAAGSNYSLLNSGGTALTGAATITVSGISGKDKIRILVKNISSASASSTISLRINADSGSNYNMFGGASKFASSTEGPVGRLNGGTDTSAIIVRLGDSAGANGDAAIAIDGGNSAGIKMIEIHSGANGVNGAGGEDYNNAVRYDIMGTWNNSATITSVSLISSAGNFDAGTMYVYTSA